MNELDATPFTIELGVSESVPYGFSFAARIAQLAAALGVNPATLTMSNPQFNVFDPNTGEDMAEGMLVGDASIDDSTGVVSQQLAGSPLTGTTRYAAVVTVDIAGAGSQSLEFVIRARP